jgi:hypothetical protein
MSRNIGRQGSIKVYLCMVVFVAVAFVGISFGKPYYRYNTLRSHTKDMLLEDIGSPEIIKAKVMGEAAALNIPLDEDNLEVTITSKKITIVKAKWSETVDFWGYYQKTLDFELDEEL